MAKELENGIYFPLVEEEDLWLANQLNVSAFRSTDSGLFVMPSFALFPSEQSTESDSLALTVGGNCPISLCALDI